MRGTRRWIAAAGTLAAASFWTVTPSTQSAPGADAAADGVRFTTLPGFTIERAVPAGKTDSYVAMTFDAEGHLIVSKEQDHPRRLIDADRDGIFESERIVSDKVRNCQGLWYDGPVLYGHCAPAEGPAPRPPGGAPSAAGGPQGGPQAGPPGGPGNQRSGLYRMADTDGDGVTDTFETLASYVGAIQEHGPHAIRRGPDGEMTLMLGNNTFLADESRIDPGSPFLSWRESQFLPPLGDGRGFGPSTKEGAHGTVHRYDRTTNRYVVVAGALRNAYDHAFNRAGELFTFDSDMEWDINMPWYRDVRTVHMVPGHDNGYRNGSGKLPPWYHDALPPVRDLGRGSPVGVEFYQARAYPAEFDDVLLEADWSRGRLLYTKLTPAGATYTARTDRAELVHGEPLNITDLEVGPDGLVYFTIGGRLTEGGLFRLRYTGRPRPAPPGVLAIVRQPQPLSSWGWAALEAKKASMGERWRSDLVALAQKGGPGATGGDRAEALHLLQRHGPAPSLDLLTTLMRDRSAEVRAAAVFAAGVQGRSALAVAHAGLKDADPLVQRRAAEAIVRMGQSADAPSLVPAADLYALLKSPHRYVRFAGRLALQRTARREWKDRVIAETMSAAQLEGLVAYVFTSPGGADLEPAVAAAFALAKRSDLPVAQQLAALRVVQLVAIEAKGLADERRRELHALLAPRFPATDARLNREIASMLAYAGQPGAVAEILAAFPKGDADQPLQIHYLYALRAVKDGWTREDRLRALGIVEKVAGWRGGASFPGFVNLMFDQLIAGFSDEEKKLAYGKLPQFAPLSEEEIAAAASAFARNRARAPANARTRGIRAISREEIVEEQIFTPQRQRPSLAAGRAAYDKICAQCHRFGGIGTEFGPDLSTLRSRFKKKDVLEAILWPSKAVSDQYETSEIETTDGNVVYGIVVNDDGRRLVVRYNQAERPVEVPKALVKERRRSALSLMPEGLVDELSQQELADLLAFLLSDPPE